MSGIILNDVNENQTIPTDKNYGSTEEAYADFKSLASTKGYTVFSYSNRIYGCDKASKCITATKAPLSTPGQDALVLVDQYRNGGGSGTYPWSANTTGLSNIKLYP